MKKIWRMTFRESRPTGSSTQNPCDLDLCLMTLIFNRALEVVRMNVHAKFHQAKCSDS